MSLRHSYTLIAPFYDAFLSAATRGARRRSLAALDVPLARDVLLVGVGTGLDIAHVPAHHRYTGLDLTHAMLQRAQRKPAPAVVRLVEGDAQAMPFADHSFDAAVLHLILAVVPHPGRCLAEAARVVRPGGLLRVFDKFLRPGEPGRWKRALNPLVRHVATRLDVVFEDALRHAPSLERQADEPALAGGWFRLIRLRKAEPREVR